MKDIKSQPLHYVILFLLELYKINAQLKGRAWSSSSFISETSKQLIELGTY